jgi:pyruvate formate-lyase activating enzyme-like uncharacterized protein
LYTTLENITEKRLAALYRAGLDEIRLHPIIWNERLWQKMDLVTIYPWKIGVEIPSIPGYERETKRLFDFLEGKISFLNLNELEISDTNANHLLQKGYIPKDRISYGVLGSETLAKKLLHYAERKDFSYAVHYCTCTLKDKIQLAERLKRRAHNVQTSTEHVTSEGMLIRGVLYLPTCIPSVGYRRKLEHMKTAQRALLLKDLVRWQTTLLRKGIITKMDTTKYRLLLHPQQLKKQLQNIPPSLVPAIVTEYPTADALAIEIDFLRKYTVKKEQ